MLEFLRALFSADFMPHGQCFLWRPEVLWLHVVSDGLIAGSYFTIPFGLAYLVRRRRDLAFHWMFWLFAAFIFACGTTHVMSIYTLWTPVYRLEGLIKAFTGLVSVGAAIAMVPMIPQALALPRPSELQLANDALAREVSERKEAEDQVRKLNEELELRVRARTAELERSNKELEQFAYVASHDLQEPMRMVTTFTQLLARQYQGQLGADADQFIGFALSGASRMQTLIADLLEYSRSDRPEVNQTTVVNATDAVKAAVDNLKGLIAETGATVVFGELPELRASRTQLIQLFQNLIGNGIKYRRDVPPRIEVAATRDGSYWVFSVTDNGVGIAPAYQEKIFNLFQRLHGRDVPGTGLGLAICRKIVQSHGGRLWVESEPGQGSRFSFSLPDVAARPDGTGSRAS